MNHFEHHQARSILDELPVLAWTATLDGDVDYVNQQWCRYTGLEAADSLGAGWTVAMHANDLPSALSRWREALRDGMPFELETRLRRADGEYLWHLVRGHALRNPAGDVIGWCGTSTDIDTRRRATEATRDSERAARLVVNTIPAHILTGTPDGALEWANKQFLTYTGRSLEELKSWGSCDVIHSDDLDRVLTEWTGHRAAGVPCEMELRLRGSDGIYRWFHYWARPERDGTGYIRRWYCLAADIDELRRVQESLHQTHACLDQAAQLAALSELSASIAHEINQPLAAVVANHHACERWLAGSPPKIDKALASIERIIRDGNAGADVTRRMQSLFGRRDPVRETLDINRIVRQVVDLIVSEVRVTGLTWETRLAPDLPAVNADPVQIQQVIANLVRNGVEAMTGARCVPGVLGVSTALAGSHVVIAVSDHGVGVAPNAVDLLFESFYTTKDNGMGMGLTICRSIAEAHGGRLRVAGNEPRGSIFSFELPIQ